MVSPFAGIHPNVHKVGFSVDEQRVLRAFSTNWYISSASSITLGKSKYNFFLAHPVNKLKELFNIEREIMFLFSEYNSFEARTLDAYDEIIKRYQSLRIEKICRVLISADSRISDQIDDLIRKEQESPVIIPFTYEELSSATDHDIESRFRKYFYERDLFAFQSPLKRDLFFFGRNEIITNISSRSMSGENSGIFGLRKSGKTSIIYGLERSFTQNGNKYLSIDCQDPSIHQRRWNELLHYIYDKIREKTNSKLKRIPIEEFDEKSASEKFHSQMTSIWKKNEKQTIVLIFDEIERISFETGSSNHWRDEYDFVYFWQSIRSSFQKSKGAFTYIVAGTNPKCIEENFIREQENPIFKSIHVEYLPPFSIDQTKEMVSYLGNIMGIQFHDSVYYELTKDFGGHPFLIRHLCSGICTEVKEKSKPVSVDKSIYTKVKYTFSLDSIDYIEMVIGVLEQQYPDEFEMAQMLAIGDMEDFNSLANADSNYTKHLLGYGIIDRQSEAYVFKIEAIETYLRNKNKHKKNVIRMTIEEKEAESNSRRNRIEKELRSLVRIIMTSQLGKNKALEVVKNSCSTSTLNRIQNTSLKESMELMYFSDLGRIISDNWSTFRNSFDLSKIEVEHALNCINKCRKIDAHSNSVSEDEFVELRLSFSKIEKAISDAA